MEIDREELERLIEAQRPLLAAVCIVGAGVAGLTLAHRLNQSGIGVVLVEAGGWESVDGLPEAVAVKAYGGSSLVWGGQLLWPNESDLQNWPIALEDVAKYLEQAERLLGVDRLPYEGGACLRALGHAVPSLLSGLGGLRIRLSKWTPFRRRNLARTIGRELLVSRNVRVLLGMQATTVFWDDGERRITGMVVQDAKGRRLRIEAGHFVIATGTVETVRLLLTAGFRQRLPTLGQNVHNHLTVCAAEIEGPARRQMLEQLRPWSHGATWHSVKIEASEELCVQLGLLPVLAHMTIEEDPASGIGVVRHLLRRDQRHTQGSWQAWLLPKLLDAAAGSLRLLWDATVHRRRYVSPQAKVRLQLNCAQQTPSASRIDFAQSVDGFGNPQAILTPKVDEHEVQTLQRFALHLKKQLEAAGVESLQWHAQVLTGERLLPLLEDARHAMGGACMGVSPATSVVDRDIQVHGIENLSIASAAVYPDGAPQLPGLLLMALALRLGDRLAVALGEYKGG